MKIPKSKASFKKKSKNSQWASQNITQPCRTEASDKFKYSQMDVKIQNKGKRLLTLDRTRIG